MRAETMNERRVVILAVLLAWVMLGPVAMAFGACGVMGLSCEGPCGASSCVTGDLPLAGLSLVESSATGLPDQNWAARSPAAPEPPPKSALLLG